MGKSIIITTGGGTDVEDLNPTATEAQVLSGYTFYSWLDDPRVGSMVNRTSLGNQTLQPGGSYTIPVGYHGGGQTVSAVSLSSKTRATATAAQILKDKTGWKDGSKITGSMANQGTINNTLSANGTYTIPQGWHNGSGKVTQSLSTQGATSITPGTSQKTIIAASKWSTGKQIVVGDSNLIASNIKKDVTIFGVKGSYDFASASEVVLTASDLQGFIYPGSKYLSSTFRETQHAKYCYDNSGGLISQGSWGEYQYHSGGSDKTSESNCESSAIFLFPEILFTNFKKATIKYALTTGLYGFNWHWSDSGNWKIVKTYHQLYFMARTLANFHRRTGSKSSGANTATICLGGFGNIISGGVQGKEKEVTIDTEWLTDVSHVSTSSNINANILSVWEIIANSNNDGYTRPGESSAYSPDSDALSKVNISGKYAIIFYPHVGLPYGVNGAPANSYSVNIYDDDGPNESHIRDVSRYYLGYTRTLSHYHEYYRTWGIKGELKSIKFHN